MALSLFPADIASTRAPGRSPSVGAGNVPIDREELFAGHAECPACKAFIRRLTPLGERSLIGDLVAGWCGVCSTTTYFAPAA